MSSTHLHATALIDSFVRYVPIVAAAHVDALHHARIIPQTHSRYVTLWIVLSAAVILYNKWVLSYSGFKYAIALTMWHMLFCSLLAAALVRGGVVEPVTISRELYWKYVVCGCCLCGVDMLRFCTHNTHTTHRGIVPIGGLFAGTLWLGNAAYLYLEVSFVQMLKVRVYVYVYVLSKEWVCD